MRERGLILAAATLNMHWLLFFLFLAGSFFQKMEVPLNCFFLTVTIALLAHISVPL